SVAASASTWGISFVFFLVRSLLTSSAWHMTQTQYIFLILQESLESNPILLAAAENVYYQGLIYGSLSRRDDNVSNQKPFGSLCGFCDRIDHRIWLGSPQPGGTGDTESARQ